MPEEWQCNVCGEVFTLSDKLICPVCDSVDIIEYNLEQEDVDPDNQFDGDGIFYYEEP